MRDDITSPGLLFEGMVSVRALLTSGKRGIEKIYYDEARVLKMPREYAFLRARAAENGFSVELLKRDEIDDMASGTTHGGICALAKERVLPGITGGDIAENGFYCVLEGIEDPYNFGYALRSLYASGVDGIILSPRNWMSAASTVCRASAGASELLSLFCCEDIPSALRLFGGAGYRIVCADIDNSVPCWNADMKRPLVLIVGGEKRGISHATLELADAVVRLPYGRDFPEALSAASAASILAFEVLRQNS